MGAPALDLVVKPQEFFRERVNTALANQRVEINDHVEFYLVNLLCEFIDPARMSAELGDVDIMDTPLAIILKQAIEAPPASRLRLFKILGDTSLYLTGFFQDYFNRKTFDMSYYITIGVNAYENVSFMLREQHSDEHIQKIYGELAAKFIRIVDVVSEVADQMLPAANSDILAVYERWIHSQSDRLRRMLEDHGINPVNTNLRTKQ